MKYWTKLRTHLDVWLRRHFFQPADARSLSLFRFLYCGLLTFMVHKYSLGAAKKFAGATWNPIPLFEQFDVPLMSLQTFEVWTVVLLAALVSTTLGVWTRISAGVSCFAFFIWMGTLLGFSKAAHTNYVVHSQNIVVVLLFILAMSPGAGRWGFDGWWKRGRRWRVTDPSQQTLPAWPRQLVKLTLALAYFGAGYCKVITSPLWADGFTLQAHLLRKFLLLDTAAGLWLANHYWLCLLLSIGTLLLELTFVVSVFVPRVTWLYVLSGLSFHGMIWLTMDINFFKFFSFTYVIYLSWPGLVAFSGVPRRLWRKVTGHGSFLASGIRAVPDGALLQSPLREARGSSLVVLGVSAMLMLCIVGRVESWPFTDYRVFQRRIGLHSVNVLRFAGETADGRRVLLKREHQPVSPSTINTRMRKHVVHGDEAAQETLVEKVAEYLGRKYPGQFTTLVLLNRTVTGVPGRSNLQINDSEFLRFDLDAARETRESPHVAGRQAGSSTRLR